MPSLINLTSKIQPKMFFSFLEELRNFWRELEFPEKDTLEVKISLQLTRLGKDGKRTAEQALQFKSLLK